MRKLHLKVKPPKQEISVALFVWFIPAISIVLVAFAPLLHSLNSAGPIHIDFLSQEALMAALFPLVGALIASRQPKNAIGWILCAIGLSEGLSVFTGQYAIYALFTTKNTFPFGAEVAWVGEWVWAMGVGLVPVLLLLFPTGHFLSRRWRWLVWFSSCMTLLSILSAMIATWGLSEKRLADLYSNNTSSNFGIYDLIGSIAFLLMMVSILLAAPCLIVRFRRAKGIEREQLKWFTYAAALFAIDGLIGTIYSNYLPNTVLLTTIDEIVNAIVIATLPLSIGIAILRYHLYDIDVIINRTLVYVSLTVFLVLIYFGSIVGLEALLHNFTQSSDLALVGSTLAIAALFQPLRRSIQKLIDRRFYRNKYDATRTLASFSTTLRGEVELNQLSEHLIGVVNETMQPMHVSLWLRNPEKEKRTIS